MEVEIALARNALARRRAVSGEARVVRAATVDGGDSLIAVEFGQLGVAEWKEQPTVVADAWVREVRVS